MSKFIQFTCYKTGKPLWIREDQILAWSFDRGHYSIVPAYDDIDIEVKERGEEILSKLEGIANARPDEDKKSVYPRRTFIRRARAVQSVEK